MRVFVRVKINNVEMLLPVTGVGEYGNLGLCEDWLVIIETDECGSNLRAGPMFLPGPRE